MSRRIAYADYLLSDHWKLTRQLALQRAGNRCQCGQCPLASFYPHELREWFPRSYSRLEVHHLTYERLGAEVDDDLLVLCGWCHSRLHGLPVASEPSPGPVPLSEVIAGLPPFRREEAEP